MAGVILVRDFWKPLNSLIGRRQLLTCPSGVTSMSVCLADKIVAVALLNKDIHSYSLVDLSRKPLKVIEAAHQNNIWSMDQNEKYLVSGSWDSTVGIWSKRDDWKKLDNPGCRALNSDVYFVAVKNDTIYASSNVGNIVIINAATSFYRVVSLGQTLYTMVISEDNEMVALAFSDDNVHTHLGLVNMDTLKTESHPAIEKKYTTKPYCCGGR
jgi:WD40 repeat protein